MMGLELKDCHSRFVRDKTYLMIQRLVEGTLVLGQVSQINPQDIAIALPNNLSRLCIHDSNISSLDKSHRVSYEGR